MRRALEVLGGEFVAEEAGRGAHGLLDDPGALCHARDQLEGVVTIPVAPCQEPATTAAHTAYPVIRISHLLAKEKQGIQLTPGGQYPS